MPATVKFQIIEPIRQRPGRALYMLMDTLDDVPPLICFRRRPDGARDYFFQPEDGRIIARGETLLFRLKLPRLISFYKEFYLVGPAAGLRSFVTFWRLLFQCADYYIHLRRSDIIASRFELFARRLDTLFHSPPPHYSVIAAHVCRA